MTKAECIRDFGQLFIMALDGLHLPADLAEYFRTFRIGGIILFADNYRDPHQLRELTASLQRQCASAEAPLFIATDHEGGNVQRFVQDFTRVPPMASFGVRAPEETECIHRRMAVELRGVGVNFNFAPVADLSVPGAEGAIGDRSFGIDPALVSEHVTAAIRGLTTENVFACAKHFPGHGATTIDSRKDLPEVRLSLEEMEGSLAPFRAAIAAGVPAIMTAHIVFPNVGDADWPASLSRYWVSEMLRLNMGFRGLIVTDAIEMKSLSTRWTPEFCGEQALRAGADLLLYYKEAHQFRAFDELRGALQRGALDVERVAESLDRVARLKQRLRASQQAA